MVYYENICQNYQWQGQKNIGNQQSARIVEICEITVAVPGRICYNEAVGFYRVCISF